MDSWRSFLGLGETHGRTFLRQWPISSHLTASKTRRTTPSLLPLDCRRHFSPPPTSFLISDPLRRRKWSTAPVFLEMGSTVELLELKMFVWMELSARWRRESTKRTNTSTSLFRRVQGLRYCHLRRPRRVALRGR